MKKTKYFYNNKREWLFIDARDRILGRLATSIARLLQGKDKPIYTPNALCGANVVVVNAKYIKVSGTKEKSKIYDKYSGYHSGRKEMSFEKLKEKNPTKPLYYAVKGMLPKNKLGRKMLRRLYIYPESVHKHYAQKPKPTQI